MTPYYNHMKSTKEIKIADNVIQQVIGQDEAVEVIKKAALQRRHVLLIGEPGTGKSMLGLALSELLPKSELQDVVCYNTAISACEKASDLDAALVLPLEMVHSSLRPNVISHGAIMSTSDKDKQWRGALQSLS